MKSLTFLTCLVLFFFLSSLAKAQDNTEEKLNLPGDNLNLYAVMKLFQESETLEGFEMKLNAEDSKINNLDLNNDDRIDYIRVIDNVDGEVHTIVLQVAVTERENQDVAVFTVEKDASGHVLIQLIGDESLYGKDYIIEPNYEDNSSSGSTPNPGYTGKTKIIDGEQVVVVNTSPATVSTWHVVTYLYLPTYTIWRSPWYWGYYPPYWNPWRPYYWDYYYGYHSHYNHYYHGHYRPTHHYSYSHWNDHYYNGHRSTSVTVYQHRQTGAYNKTYSRPETRSQGSAEFRKRNPDYGRPAVKPGNNNSTRPGNRPGTTNTKERPTGRPGTNNTNERPTARPGTNSTKERPTTRPGTNNTIERPSTRPAISKPPIQSEPGRQDSRPANQPAARPATGNPGSKRDVVQPGNRQENRNSGAKQNVNQPAPRQSTSSPSARPGNSRPAPSPAPARQTSSPKQSKPQNTERPNR